VGGRLHRVTEWGGSKIAFVHNSENHGGVSSVSSTPYVNTSAAIYSTLTTPFNRGSIRMPTELISPDEVRTARITARIMKEPRT
jgi:hypothetical protein